MKSKMLLDYMVNLEKVQVLDHSPLPHQERLTSQDFYSLLAGNLLSMTDRSHSEDGMCRLRDSRGNLCAIGTIIHESRYNRYLERCLLTEYIITREGNALRIGAEIYASLSYAVSGKQVRVMKVMQYIHDQMVGMTRWPNLLREVAEFYNFDSSIVDDKERSFLENLAETPQKRREIESIHGLYSGKLISGLKPQFMIHDELDMTSVFKDKMSGFWPTKLTEVDNLSHWQKFKEEYQKLFTMPPKTMVIPKNPDVYKLLTGEEIPNKVPQPADFLPPNFALQEHEDLLGDGEPQAQGASDSGIWKNQILMMQDS